MDMQPLLRLPQQGLPRLRVRLLRLRVRLSALSLRLLSRIGIHCHPVRE